MWARLPWRVLTAAAALATGTEQGVTFATANLCWSLGDVAIGSLDWGRTEPNPGLVLKGQPAKVRP